MAFRANEEAAKGLAQARQYYIYSLPPELREDADSALLRLIEEYGPVVDSYPAWHPFICHTITEKNLIGKQPMFNSPLFEGADRRTICLRNAFITVIPSEKTAAKLVAQVMPPYHSEEYKSHVFRKERDACIEAEILDTKFYREDRTAVLVTCRWLDEEGVFSKSLEIPKNAALGKMLETELIARHVSDLSEPWVAMRYHLLGAPHGSRSSLFVDEKVGQDIKNVFIAISEKAEMFGPLKWAK